MFSCIPLKLNWDQDSRSSESEILDRCVVSAKKNETEKGREQERRERERERCQGMEYYVVYVFVRV